VISGISGGGDMAVFTACAMPGRFRAVMTVAASILPRVGCHRIRIVAVHGDADPVDPYLGKPGPPGYLATPPAAAAIALWSIAVVTPGPEARQLTPRSESPRATTVPRPRSVRWSD